MRSLIELNPAVLYANIYVLPICKDGVPSCFFVYASIGLQRVVRYMRETLIWLIHLSGSIITVDAIGYNWLIVFMSEDYGFSGVGGCDYAILFGNLSLESGLSTV